MRILQTLDKAVVLIFHPIIVIAGLTVTSTMVIGIFSRYVLNAPIFGLEEIMLLAVMWFYMLGAAMASRDRSHLSTDFMKVITKKRSVLRSAEILSTLISIGVSIMVVMWSYDLMVWGFQKGQTTPVFSVPWVASQSSLFVASVFFVIYLVRDLIIELKNDPLSCDGDQTNAE